MGSFFIMQPHGRSDLQFLQNSVLYKAMVLGTRDTMWHTHKGSMTSMHMLL